MRCKAPGGKYAKWISKSRNAEKWKGFSLNFEKSKNQKVEESKRCKMEKGKKNETLEKLFMLSFLLMISGTLLPGSSNFVL